MLNSCKVRRNTRTREIDQVVIDRPFTDERANVIYNYYRSVGIPIHLGKKAMQQELLRRGYNLDFQIIGERGVAILTDSVQRIVSLSNAKKLKEQGKSDKDIWIATGWQFDVVDQKWKTEIADEIINPLLNLEEVQRKIQEFQGQDITIPLNIIYSAQVFEAYPQLNDIQLIFSNRLEGLAATAKGENFIVLNPNTTLEELQKTLLHELHHKISEYEGFSEGASFNRIYSEYLSDFIGYGGTRVLTESLHQEILTRANRDYFYSNGEFGARTTEDRADLSAEERRLTPLFDDVDEDSRRYVTNVLPTLQNPLDFLSTSKGEVYGFVTPEGEMFLDPDIAGVNTLIHEGAHIHYKVLKTAAERGDFKAQAILNKIQELTAPAVETIFNAKKAQERSSDSMTSVDMQAEQSIIKKMPELTELANKNIQIIKDYDRYQRILQKQAEGRRVLKTDRAFLDSHPELKNPPILDFGTPSDILRSVGITNPIKISMSHITKKLVGKEAHELTLLDLQDLMRAIHNPATVNKGAKGRVQLLTNHTNSNGAPIVVVLDNNFKADTASITTAYAITNLTKVVPETSQDVLYTNNKKLADFLSDYSESKNRGFGIALFSYPEYDSSTGTIKYIQEKINPKIEFDVANIRKIIENTKYIINKTNVSQVDFQIEGNQTSSIFDSEGNLNIEELNRIVENNLITTNLTKNEKEGLRRASKYALGLFIISREAEKKRATDGQELVEETTRRAIEDYSRAQQKIWSQERINQNYDYFSEGSEAVVYKSKDGTHVLKQKNVEEIELTYTPTDFIKNRVILYNTLFPDSTYEIVGITEQGDFLLKQDFVEGKTLTELFLDEEIQTREEVLEIIDKEVKRRFEVEREDRGVYFTKDYIIADISEYNIIQTTDGRFIIDAITVTNNQNRVPLSIEIEQDLDFQIIGEQTTQERTTISPEVLSSPAYNQRENETDEQYKERLIEEVYATALGSNGEQYLKDLGFTAQEAKTFLQKVQEFLAEIVDWLRGKKGLQDLSVDEINRLSIREFLDRSTTSMMLGEFKDPSQTSALSPNREVQVYITPATVRNFNEETLRLKELSDEYNNVAKEISQGNLENQERFTILQNEILDTYQEHIQEKVSKIRGVNVSFNQPYLGSWQGNYEPSLNMTLSISPNADTGAISGLLFDIAENTSQDAFILEERSEIEGRKPLTEFDEAGMSHYPQIRVIFDKQLTVEEKSIVAQRLISKGIDDFSIDGDYFIASILDFKSKTNKQKEEFYDKKHAAITTLFTGEGEKIGTNKVKDIQEHIRKSRYVDARNAGDKQSQTREYDRSDLFEAQSPNINPQISGEQELQQPQIAVQRAIQRNNGHPLHLAPNGKPSILYQSYRDLGYTEQQAKELTAQVYSDNFLNWFGDWINDPQNSSKVVDSNGQPMLMYHGSPSIDIEVFDRSKSKASSSGLKEFGDFFTSNRRLANLYRTKELSKEAIEERNFQIRKYTELLHSARNNKDFDIYNNILNSLKEGRVYTTFLNIRTPLEGDAKGMDYDAWSYMKLDIGYKTARGRGDVLEAISGNNTAYDSPFDGALIHNMADMLSWGKDVSEYIGTVAMTLRPNQIKSATDNVGTFSSESNNINFQISGEIGASDNRSSQTQGFFSDVVTGASDRFKPNKPYQVEVQYTPKQQAFEEVYSKHRGNFDEHIATSIPRFRETQVQKGTAISAVISQIPDAKVLDIGGSEGSFVKSITEVSGAQSINLEPNPDMAESHRSTPVTGSEVVQEAFYEGFGDVQAYRPTDKFDVVHESMVFQFITSNRVNFVKEVVDNYLKEGGLFITEEKLKTGEQTYIENEIQKDTQHKSKYYDESQLKTKAEEILGGMNENQASAYEYLSLLRENFDYVGIYWNSGNFYGIVATNSKERFNHFMQEVGDTTSEYTKHPIGEVTDEVIERIRQEEVEQPLTTDTQGVQVLEYQGSTLSYKQRVNPITNQPTNQIEIDLISVPQENRRQGHARELLRRMTEIADSRGQELYLFAAPRDRTTTTEGLIKLYKEFGFESISSFLPEEMVRPARRDSQRAEESLPPAETLLTVDLDGVQEYVPADKIITYYSEMGEINYKENSEGELVMLKTISATPQQEESITYKQLLSIPNLSKEQALEAYKNLYSTDYYDWKNKTNEC